MSWWSRLFGQKAVTFVPPLGEYSSVVMGYPNWPIFDSYGQMYRRQPAVRTVVDFLARNIAQLNPKIYERVDDTDRREWNDHPLAKLLRDPNPTTTRYAHLRDTVADIAIYDRAYWRMVRSRGLVSALVRLPPSRLQIEFDQQTFRTTYRFDGAEISRRDMVIFHGYHPDGNEEGVSPLETLRRVLSEEWAATTHREWYWRNAARQSGIIERGLDAPEWDNNARERFRQQWEGSMTGGVNSGRTAILEDGMKWNPNGFSPKDSEYIEGRKLTYTEVARVYGPALVSLVSDSGGVTATEANHRHLYQDALAPVLRMLQDEIDGQLLTLDEFNLGSPTYCEFNLADKLKGSFEEQGRTLVTSVGVPYMSVNEGRARLNLPRIPDPVLDVPVQPLNVLYGGQPSVVVPTSDPGMQSAELATKLRDFFDRQQRSVTSLLGGLPDQGETTVLVAWKEDRWNLELARVFHPAPDALSIAVEINRKHRDQVVAAFTAAGLSAVHGKFHDFKNTADELASLRFRQPALTA